MAGGWPLLLLLASYSGRSPSSFFALEYFSNRSFRNSIRAAARFPSPLLFSAWCSYKSASRRPVGRSLRSSEGDSTLLVPGGLDSTFNFVLFRKIWQIYLFYSIMGLLICGTGPVAYSDVIRIG